MWIEINIECSNVQLQDEFLMRFVKPVVDEYRNRIQSWHFLWEGKPYPLTLMTRFYGDQDTLLKLSDSLERILADVNHCYGRHGDCNSQKEYEGEVSWGDRVWERGVKFMEFGSEFALELVENRDQLGNSVNYKKDAFFYADRYTHLFLNQISSLVNESDFYLIEGISRYACEQRIALSPERRNNILQRTKETIGVNL